MNEDDPISVRMAFNFYDYDNDGSIGSVDILNLKRHYTPLAKVEVVGGFQSFEALTKIFEEARIKRSMKNTFSYVLKSNQ